MCVSKAYRWLIVRFGPVVETVFEVRLVGILRICTDGVNLGWTELFHIEGVKGRGRLAESIEAIGSGIIRRRMTISQATHVIAGLCVCTSRGKGPAVGDGIRRLNRRRQTTVNQAGSARCPLMGIISRCSSHVKLVLLLASVRRSGSYRMRWRCILPWWCWHVRRLQFRRNSIFIKLGDLGFQRFRLCMHAITIA